MSGTYEATLRIDDVIESLQKITLAAGTSRTVSFTATKSEVKSYRVAIDRLASTFSVIGPPVKVIESRMIKHPNLDYDYYVVGLVKNNGNRTLEVEITAILRDEQGNLIRTTEYGIWYSSFPAVLRPGELKPFRLDFEKDDSVVSADVQVSWKEPFWDWNFDLKVSGSNMTYGGHGPVIYGAVKNRGSSKAKSIQAVGAFYNASREIIWAYITYTDPSELLPGGTGTFQCNSMGEYAGIEDSELPSSLIASSYDVWVQGYIPP